MNKEQDKIEKILRTIFKKLNIKIKEKTIKIFSQIIKFTIVGGLAFVIDAAVGLVCKSYFGLATWIATALGFIVSVIFNYILSILWVFDVNKEKSSKRNFILFIIFSVIGFLITELIMVIGVDVIGAALFSEKYESIIYLIVKILATLIVMVFNFITRKLFLE